MNMFKAYQQLWKIKFRLIFCKLLDFSQVEKHFSTCANIHYEK
jgi:hypothetical protein